MLVLRRFTLLLTLAALLALPAQAFAVERIVTLNGDFTEILFALGHDDKIVAVDASSNYPPEALELPSVGYQGRLSLEAILAHEPTLVLANKDAGPVEVLEQLAALGVRVEIITPENTIESPVENVRKIAGIIGAVEEGEKLAAQIEEKIAAAAALGKELEKTPRVLFLYLGSAQIQFAAGANSPANVMIEAAGAIDAGAEAGFVGYMPLTPEAVVAAQPDVIIVTERGLATVGGIEGVLNVPGVAQTPAGINRRIISFEDLYFLGMGPRTGDALLDLVQALHDMQ